MVARRSQTGSELEIHKLSIPSRSGSSSSLSRMADLSTNVVIDDIGNLLFVSCWELLQEFVVPVELE